MIKILTKLKTAYKSMAIPARASIWFVVCYALQRGIQFLSVPIFTRLMTQEEYGLYTVFLSWFNIIVIFSSLNIHTGAFAKGLVKYENERDRYVSSIQTLTILSTVVFGFFIICFSNQICINTGFSSTTLFFMLLNLLSYPILQLWILNQRSQYLYKRVVIVTLLNTSLSVLIGVICVICFDNKSNALIGAFVIVQFIISIILYVVQSLKGKLFYYKKYWIWTVGLAIPLMPHTLSEILLYHSDRIMINSMCGQGKAAIYTIVYQLSMIMMIIRTGINGAYTPWLYYSIRDQRYKRVRSITRDLAIIMAVITVGIMAIGPELLRLAAPISYYEAVRDIPAIMIGCHFIFIYLLFANVEIYYEQKKYVSLASVATAIINIILNYICIPKFGYLVAGYTTLVSYILMACMHYAFLKRLEKKHKEIGEIFDIKQLFCASFYVLVAGCLLFLVYDNIVIRWTIILIVAICAYCNRKKIENLLSSIKRK